MNNTSTTLGDYKLISPFVIQGKIKHYDSSLLVHPVITYVIDRCVSESLSHDKKEIFEDIENTFGEKILFKNKVNAYMEENGDILSHTVSVFATSNLKRYVEQTEEFKDRLSKVKKDDGERLTEELVSLFENPYSINMYKGVETALMLRKTKTGEPDLYYLALYYDIIRHPDSIMMTLDSMIQEVSEDLNDKDILKILSKEDTVFVSLLEKLNIVRLSDLKSLSSYALITLYAYTLGRVVRNLAVPDDDSSFLSPIEQIKKTYTGYYDSLTPTYKTVADERLSLSEKKRSLQDIGDEVSLTRERIRQISESINRNLNKLAHKNSYLFSEIASSVLDGRPFNSLESLREEFDNETVYSLFIRSFNFLSLPYRYESRLDALYDADKTDPDEIIEKEASLLPDSLSEKDFERLAPLQKKVVLLTYRLSSKNFYIKNGVKKTDLILDAVDKNFEDGFQMSDREAYSRLKDILVNEYGLSSQSLPTLHSLQALFERGNYCLIRRGTYKNSKRCVILPDDLLQEILSYIESNPPILFYKTIYQKFEGSLLNAGIDNSYYLKGLLDPKLYLLNCSCNTKRDYIQIGEMRIKSKDMIVEKIRSYEGVFSLRDLSNDFPGVRQYTFLNELYKEIENSLIWLSGNRFIYFEKLNIDETDIHKLRDYVLSSFPDGTTSLSSRRIFENLKNDDPSLIERLHIPTDTFSFFSLLREVLKDKLFFSRPMIYSEEELLERNIYDGFKKHFLSFDTFTADDIINYFELTYAKISANILPFFVDISDDYVQVDRRRVVRKDVLDISKEDLDTIESFINTLIDENGGVLKAEDVTDFSSLPLIQNYPWCSELLTGITRSYLYNNLKVVSTTNNLRTARFRIKKK